MGKGISLLILAFRESGAVKTLTTMTMKKPKTFICPDMNDNNFIHLYYEGSQAGSKFYVCSFFRDNLWDIFGEEYYRQLERIKPGEFVEVNLALEF